ncbi:MAG: NADP-dependent malic enzyme [Candidatus Gracilibacteria bacterium]
MNYFEESLILHKKLSGKLETISKIKIENKNDLSLAYTPGVAEPCREIFKDKSKVYDYTLKANTVAVISDGSAVLGLGNIGPEAGLPVMEGKCVLFKEFAGVNAFPIVLDTQDTEEIIKTIKNIAPTFGGINLEDFSAPRCFEIEERLKKELDIPVFHDDQHGTAVVVLAGIINSLKVTNRKKEKLKIIVNGLGAAGTAIIKLLYLYGIKNIIVCDSKGIVSKKRGDLNNEKQKILEITNTENISGTLKDAVVGRDLFIGVSAPLILTTEMVKTMNKDSIIFAMANPTPEIMPEDAYVGGAKIVATGRSDYPNQLNNVLVFPGVFKGALENKVRMITDDMKINAAIALASAVENPTVDKIIPSPFEREVVDIIANAIR